MPWDLSNIHLELSRKIINKLIPSFRHCASSLNLLVQPKKKKGKKWHILNIQSKKFAILFFEKSMVLRVSQ